MQHVGRRCLRSGRRWLMVIGWSRSLESMSDLRLGSRFARFIVARNANSIRYSVRSRRLEVPTAEFEKFWLA